MTTNTCFNLKRVNKKNRNEKKSQFNKSDTNICALKERTEKFFFRPQVLGLSKLTCLLVSRSKFSPLYIVSEYQNRSGFY